MQHEEGSTEGSLPVSSTSSYTSADDVIMFYEESVVVDLGKFGR